MHKHLPDIFIFIDHYNSEIFRNKNLNIGIVYRNYNSASRKNELIKVAKECKKNRYQLFVSNSIKLALKVKANGIYIPSFNKSKKFYNLEKKRIIILGSAHNQKEINTKISQNCNAIFLSPIFYVKKQKSI
jgi:thiamine-phosphate pyrophosphorylase